MTLKNTIRGMVKEYPTLFQDRVQCLDHLFCTNGNGYDWVDGQLVYPEHIRRLEERDRARRDVERPFDEEQIIENMMQMTPRQWIDVRGGVDVRFNLSEFTQRMLVEYFRKSRALKNIDKIATPGFHDWAYTNHRFYPVCEYSKLLCLPRDIKPDWLAGAEETLVLLKKYGCNPAHGIDLESIALKYMDET